ncbi:MAG: DUF3568 domain-containing protein [Phycisphaerales bacterium]|nr:DUF3568 domain-containing protein [Phycisphaerales bacterium]
MNARRGLATVIGVLGMAMLCGCARPEPTTHGRDRSVMAEFAMGNLEAVLPAKVGVLAVRASTEQTLRSRGYVITESFGSRDRFQVDASGPGSDGRRDRTRVEGWLTPNGTRVRVEAGLFGDETAAKAILDETLTRLGI